jgi:hypothetical protein
LFVANSTFKNAGLRLLYDVYNITGGQITLSGKYVKRAISLKEEEVQVVKARILLPTGRSSSEVVAGSVQAFGTIADSVTAVESGVIIDMGIKMSRVDEIKAEIEALPDEEYVRLRQWFSEEDWQKRLRFGLI